jgi:xanthine dehydrogenase YagS FAD-binding subunit
MSWQIAIDEPKSFELLAPSTIEQALEWAARHGSDAAFLAGGCDLLDQLKNQWFNPRYVINLKSIPALKGITNSGNSLAMGALTTLGEIERHPDLRKTVPGLEKAANRAATPQIRNVGTVGGNLLQDSRCAYYRGPWHCYRAGGIVCDAHHGVNIEHAIFGGDRCFTVSPSDTAPMLVAMEAIAKVHSPRGSYELPVADLFVSPEEDILHMHRLLKGEILTELHIPIRAGQRSTFIKHALRNSWDFALASVAVTFTRAGSAVRDCRIVLGGVAPIPWRCLAAEHAIEGTDLSAEIIEAAARAAVEHAKPLRYNEYKVGLVRKLVREALTELAQ